MSGPIIFNRYDNGQCTCEVTPREDRCELNTSRPPDRETADRSDEFVTSKGNAKTSAGKWTLGAFASSFGLGCSDELPDPPAPDFENPDIVCVSVTPNGARPNKGSGMPSVSGDGRFIAFSSDASDLVDGDKNDARDIFVYDRQSGMTERISVSDAGDEANDSSAYPSISADGRYIAFLSFAKNLVPDDNNARTDIFVRDRQEKKTERVSVSASGDQANDDSIVPSISADGRYVAFNSKATNLVPFGKEGVDGVFVYDRYIKEIKRASVRPDGEDANGSSGSPSISGDGSVVAFGSWATNLDSIGTGGRYNVYLRNMITGALKMISVPATGEMANGDSSLPSVSADGSSVVFLSRASNLVLGDEGEGWDTFAYNVEKKEIKGCSLKSKTTDAYYDRPSVSADGRFIAFTSDEKLTPDDKNGMSDVYVYDTKGGKLARVSRARKGGKEVNDGSAHPSISGDGKFISFTALSLSKSSSKLDKQDVFVAKNPLYSE